MRKDKGLNGDRTKLPMLTWVMFLEVSGRSGEDRRRTGEAKKAKVPTGHRNSLSLYGDWAAQEDGISGDALIKFVDHEEAVRPDGTKGPGLTSLRSLQGSNGDDRRDVVASVFWRQQSDGKRLPAAGCHRNVNGIHF
ncbi:MAG: hypothetical protein R3C12_24010 [Planctomycetaceae bacterium]